MVFYYVHGTKKHFCFLFDKNSVDEKIGLVEEKPLTKKDVVRSLEIVVHCGQVPRVIHRFAWQMMRRWSKM